MQDFYHMGLLLDNINPLTFIFILSISALVIVGGLIYAFFGEFED